MKNNKTDGIIKHALDIMMKINHLNDVSNGVSVNDLINGNDEFKLKHLNKCFIPENIFSTDDGIHYTINLIDVKEYLKENDERFYNKYKMLFE